MNSLELAGRKRVIRDPDGQPAFAGVERWALRHRP